MTGVRIFNRKGTKNYQYEIKYNGMTYPAKSTHTDHKPTAKIIAENSYRQFLIDYTSDGRSPITLRDALEAFRNHQTSENLTDGSLVATRTMARRLLSEQYNRDGSISTETKTGFSGDRYLHEITSKDVSQMQQKLVKEGLSTRYLKELWQVLARSIDHASGILNCKTPIPELRYPKNTVKQKEIRTISFQEEKKILAYLKNLDNKQHHDFFIYLMQTGSRNIEARTQVWSNVDLENRIVTLEKAKGGKTYRLSMTNELHEMLLKRKKNAVNEYVFEGIKPMKGNTIVTHRSYHRNWLHDAAIAVNGSNEGERRIVGHTCRHTFCTRLLQKGGIFNILNVSRIMGHSSVKQTERYAHYIPAPDEMKGSLQTALNQVEPTTLKLEIEPVDLMAALQSPELDKAGFRIISEGI